MFSFNNFILDVLVYYHTYDSYVYVYVINTYNILF